MNKFLLSAPLLLAVAVPAFAQTMAPTDYVASAGASDLFEKQSSKLVLQSTHDPKIKSFATMMITDHTKSTAMVKHAAMQDKVMAPPPMLMPAQQQMITELRAAKGAARDQTYVTQQKTAHDMALTLQQSYANDGTAPALKTAAASIVPVVQQHIEMLKTM